MNASTVNPKAGDVVLIGDNHHSFFGVVRQDGNVDGKWMCKTILVVPTGPYRESGGRPFLGNYRTSP